MVTATLFTLASLPLGTTTIAFADDVDLVMTLVSGPTSAAKGEQISITNRVTNNGTVGTDSSFTVGLYLSTDMNIDPSSDIFLGSRIVPCCLTTLTPPQRASQTSTLVTIPSTVSSGTYYLGAYADIPPPDGVIAERDESNNALAGNSITIERDPGGRGGDGGGCGTLIRFGDDDHSDAGIVAGDILVLVALLIVLYGRRHWSRWIKMEPISPDQSPSRGRRSGVSRMEMGPIHLD
jgi:hypothetical protein